MLLLLLLYSIKEHARGEKVVSPPRHTESTPELFMVIHNNMVESIEGEDKSIEYEDDEKTILHESKIYHATKRMMTI